jgi:hypothetical protein
MKNLSLVLVLLMTTSYAFSASKKNLNTTNQTKFDIRVPVKNWLKKMNDGFTVGLAKGSLDFNSQVVLKFNLLQVGKVSELML